MDLATSKFLDLLALASERKQDIFFAQQILGAWKKAEADRQPLTFTKFWNTCERGDWMLWVARFSGVRREVVTLAACACAREALKFLSLKELPSSMLDYTEEWAHARTSRDSVDAGLMAMVSYFATSGPLSLKEAAAAAAITGAILGDISTPVSATNAGCDPKKLAELVRGQISTDLVLWALS